MNSIRIAMVFCLFFSAFLFSGCAAPAVPKAESEAEQVRTHFDGYDWSWHCWDDEVKFTLWKENIIRLEKTGNFWMVEGFSSDRGAFTKESPIKIASSDETGKVLFVYDKENGKVVDKAHGNYQNASVGPDGKITGSVSTYC